MDIPEELARVTTMALDVDGTLTNADHLVSEASLSALKKLDEAGVQLIITTGRAPTAAASTLHDAGLHGWISACNGAHVSDLATGEVLRTAPVPPEVITSVLDLCDEADIACSIFTADDILVSRPGMLFDFVTAANPGSPPTITDLRTIDPATVLKLMPATDKDQMAELFPRFRELAPLASLSLDQTCEIIGPGAGKEHGLAFLFDRLQVSPDQVAGMGDGGNDVGWLSMIGWPIAMGNARDEVKEVARLEIGHHLDDAMATFVDDWLAARERLGITQHAKQEA